MAHIKTSHITPTAGAPRGAAEIVTSKIDADAEAAAFGRACFVPHDVLLVTPSVDGKTVRVEASGWVVSGHHPGDAHQYRFRLGQAGSEQGPRMKPRL